MSDFVEWNPKHHGHKPLHWTPDMLTSVDGKNFARQPNWAWIAGSTYYVPHEAVGVVREDVEPEPIVTDADRIEALTAENQRLLVSNEQWQVDYNEAVIDKLELETENERLLQIAQRLGTYSAHDDDCRIMTHGVWSDPIPCTCGYTDAWQAHLTAIRKQP